MLFQKHSLTKLCLLRYCKESYKYLLQSLGFMFYWGSVILQQHGSSKYKLAAQTARLTETHAWGFCATKGQALMLLHWFTQSRRPQSSSTTTVSSRLQGTPPAEKAAARQGKACMPGSFLPRSLKHHNWKYTQPRHQFNSESGTCFPDLCQAAQSSAQPRVCGILLLQWRWVWGRQATPISPQPCYSVKRECSVILILLKSDNQCICMHAYLDFFWKWYSTTPLHSILHLHPVPPLRAAPPGLPGHLLFLQQLRC